MESTNDDTLCAAHSSSTKVLTDGNRCLASIYSSGRLWGPRASRRRAIRVGTATVLRCAGRDVKGGGTDSVSYRRLTRGTMQKIGGNRGFCRTVRMGENRERFCLTGAPFNEPPQTSPGRENSRRLPQIRIPVSPEPGIPLNSAAAPAIPPSVVLHCASTPPCPTALLTHLIKTT